MRHRVTAERHSRANDHLVELSERGFEPDPQHPDVDAVNEAAKLADLFNQCTQLSEVQSGPADQREWMDFHRSRPLATGRDGGCHPGGRGDGDIPHR